MTPAIHRPHSNVHAFVVPCPRASDAIGVALCQAYRGPGMLPADIAASLAALDLIERP